LYLTKKARNLTTPPFLSYKCQSKTGLIMTRRPIFSGIPTNALLGSKKSWLTAFFLFCFYMVFALAALQWGSVLFLWDKDVAASSVLAILLSGSAIVLFHMQWSCEPIAERILPLTTLIFILLFGLSGAFLYLGIEAAEYANLSTNEGLFVFSSLSMKAQAEVLLLLLLAPVLGSLAVSLSVFFQNKNGPHAEGPHSNVRLISIMIIGAWFIMVLGLLQAIGSYGATPRPQMDDAQTRFTNILLYERVIQKAYSTGAITSKQAIKEWMQWQRRATSVANWQVSPFLAMASLVPSSRFDSFLKTPTRYDWCLWTAARTGSSGITVFQRCSSQPLAGELLWFSDDPPSKS
jgi:hypothetical protein